ncbi:thrombospondin type-1 domain-containing protein 7B isoform X1, partial [Lates japonicus]
MGWTMILKDDFGVIAWTRRAGCYLSLFLLLSLFSIPVQSDIVFHKDHRFSWKA